MEIGLQTYTVKKSIGTPEGFDKTMAEVSAAGIKYLEIAVDYLKFPFDTANATMMKDVLDKYGVTAVSCQVRQAKVESNTESFIKTLRILGVSNITNSVIDVRCLKDGAHGIAAYAEKLENYRLKLETSGIFVAHHNHHFECLRFDGKTALDIIADNFRGNFVLDTYWLTRGGLEPVSVIKRLTDRVKIMHIRDFKLKLGLTGLKPKDAAIGCGNIDFEHVFYKASRLGVEYGMIEQSTKNELECVRISASNALAIKGRI